MRPGAHTQGYNTDGSYTSKLRGAVRGRRKGGSNEPKEGQTLMREVPAEQRRLSPKMRKPAGMHAALWEFDVAPSGALALKDRVATTSFQQTVCWSKTASVIGLLARSDDDRLIVMYLESFLKRLSKSTVVLSEKQYLRVDSLHPSTSCLTLDWTADRPTKAKCCQPL